MVKKEIVDKEFELLKLSYESSRTWALSFFALMITTFIGYSVMMESNIVASAALFKCSGYLAFGAIVLYFIESRNLIKLRKYLKSKN